MASMLKVPSKSYVLDTKYEIEINGKVEVRDLKITKTDFFKLQDMLNNETRFNVIRDFILKDFLKITGKVKVDEDYLFDMVEIIAQEVNKELSKTPFK